jgi:hypothetical protein
MSAKERPTNGVSHLEINREHGINWWGPGSSPQQRAVLGALAIVVATVVMVPLNYFAGIDDWPMVTFYAVVAVAVGLYIRHWLAIPTAYIGWVGTLILSEIALYLIMGANWWEEQNAAHWQGTEAASIKLMGQLMEIAFLGLFIAALAGVGALIGWLIYRLALRE